MRKVSLILWSLLSVLLMIALVCYWREMRFNSPPRLTQEQVLSIAAQVANAHKERLEIYTPMADFDSHARM